jgi:hypothetical protein
LQILDLQFEEGYRLFVLCGLESELYFSCLPLSFGMREFLFDLFKLSLCDSGLVCAAK